VKDGIIIGIDLARPESSDKTVLVVAGYGDGSVIGIIPIEDDIKRISYKGVVVFDRDRPVE